MKNKLFPVLLALAVILGSQSLLFNWMKKIPTTALPVINQAYPDLNTEKLHEFVQSVINGDSNTIVGIYITGVMALPVGQQPEGDASYVTRDPNQVTQFGLASRYHTIGILAHNDLAGAQFSEIHKDSYVVIVYGDGRMIYFQVDDIQKYQALSPTSTYSDFVDLANTNQTFTAGRLFDRVYGAGNRLVLQTCLARFGNPSWGRIFIIAKPASSQTITLLTQPVIKVERNFSNLAIMYR